jgi:hypothetical protein
MSLFARHPISTSVAIALVAAGLLAAALLFSGSSSGQSNGLRAGNTSPYPKMGEAGAAHSRKAKALHRTTLRAAGRFDTVKKARRLGYAATGKARRPGLRRFVGLGRAPARRLRARRPQGLVFWCPSGGDCQLAALVHRAPAAADPRTLGGLLGWHRQSRRAAWSTRVWLTGSPRTALAQCVPFGALHARNARISWQSYRPALPRLDAPCRPGPGQGRVPGDAPPSDGPGAVLRTDNCMPQPSACGFPDATNTGVPPGTPLTRATGTVHLDTPGMTYSGVELHGRIVVEAPNVTIEKVKIVCPCYYPILTWPVERGAGNTVVRDVEIDFQGFDGGKGIAFAEYTAQRVWFHNGMDCAHFSVNVTITDSFCDLTKVRPGSDAHADGFQDTGGVNIAIRHNTIRNPNGQTSAILLPTGQSSVVVDNNLMSGGGWTLYCGDSGDENETITNNRFSREFFAKGGYWGPMAGCQDARVASGNVWDDTGRTLRP